MSIDTERHGKKGERHLYSLMTDEQRENQREIWKKKEGGCFVSRTGNNVVITSLWVC